MQALVLHLFILVMIVSSQTMLSHEREKKTRTHAHIALLWFWLLFRNYSIYLHIWALSTPNTTTSMQNLNLNIPIRRTLEFRMNSYFWKYPTKWFRIEVEMWQVSPFVYAFSCYPWRCLCMCFELLCRRLQLQRLKRVLGMHQLVFVVLISTMAMLFNQQRNYFTFGQCNFPLPLETQTF